MKTTVIKVAATFFFEGEVFYEAAVLLLLRPLDGDARASGPHRPFKR